MPGFAQNVDGNFPIPHRELSGGEERRGVAIDTKAHNSGIDRHHQRAEKRDEYGQ